MNKIPLFHGRFLMGKLDSFCEYLAQLRADKKNINGLYPDFTRMYNAGNEL